MVDGDMIMDMAKAAHKGQTRDDGKNYYENHICGVVAILIEADYYVIDRCRFLTDIAQLHDVLEDCDEWVQENDFLQKLIESCEMEWEHDIILGSLKWLTTSGDFEKYGVYIKESTKASRITQLMENGPNHAITVKLADRIHNVRSMRSAWDVKRQRKYLISSKDMITSMYRGFESRDLHLIPDMHSLILRLTALLVDEMRDIEYRLDKD